MNEWLRSFSAFVWLGAALYFTPALIRAMSDRARCHDWIWSVFWFLAVNRITYGVRGMYASEESWLFAACHIFAILAAALMIVVARAYGRADGR